MTGGSSDFIGIMLSVAGFMILGFVIYTLFFQANPDTGIPTGIQWFTRLMYR